MTASFDLLLFVLAIPPIPFRGNVKFIRVQCFILPLAQQRIELDLDDGVKVNYQKSPGLFGKIPGFDKKQNE